MFCKHSHYGSCFFSWDNYYRSCTLIVMIVVNGCIVRCILYYSFHLLFALLFSFLGVSKNLSHNKKKQNKTKLKSNQFFLGPLWFYSLRKYQRPPKGGGVLNPRPHNPGNKVLNNWTTLFWLKSNKMWYNGV